MAKKQYGQCDSEEELREAFKVFDKVFGNFTAGISRKQDPGHKTIILQVQTFHTHNTMVLYTVNLVQFLDSMVSPMGNDPNL